MTLDDLRALCDAPGWTTERVARAIGRDPTTLRDWLRGAEAIGRNAADWLGRVQRLHADGDAVTIVVDTPAGPKPRPVA